jgi:outer membrane beta-barrel protein
MANYSKSIQILSLQRQAANHDTDLARTTTGEFPRMRLLKCKILLIAATTSLLTFSGTSFVAAQQPKQAEPEIEIDPTKPAPEPEIELEPENKTNDLAADLAASDAAAPAVEAAAIRAQPLSWSDIRVVVRKPFLKQKRTELLPLVSITANDNMVRHVGFGGQLNYFLTDVLAVGVEGNYYVRQFREPFDLVARQARRLPTVNQYNFSGALNFHYVPIYGKFAVLDKHLITWEAQFTAGIGAAQTEVIPRDAKFPGFSSIVIQPNIGASMRFFLTKFITINFGVRDYIFIDKFEPTNRSAMMNATADQAKDNAATSLINNVMFQAGLSFWVPTGFDYTTFR